jgi:hypothetical protein
MILLSKLSVCSPGHPCQLSIPICLLTDSMQLYTYDGMAHVLQLVVAMASLMEWQPG